MLSLAIIVLSNDGLCKKPHAINKVYFTGWILSLQVVVNGNVKF